MSNNEFDKSKVIKYLIWTFILAYAVQFGAAHVYNGGNKTAATFIIAAMMFVPALGALLSGTGLRDMGWKPRIRKNIKTILIAWFAPILFTALGAALYFLLFPGHFSLDGEYVAFSAGEEIFKQLEAQGISYPVYALISVLGAAIYGPFVNMFFALGEEVGWRGFLYPQLKARFGRNKGLLLGGVIWGAWHWPLIWLIGYEYGAYTGNTAGYRGFFPLPRRHKRGRGAAPLLVPDRHGFRAATGTPAHGSRRVFAVPCRRRVRNASKKA